jgi:predicted AlkP superfamily pyrophosphatase or phosphodiesterase
MSSHCRWKWTAALGVVILAFVSFGFFSGAGQPPAGAGPRLAVLVVFDQMRGDYLTRWEKLFQERGFHRLMKEGAWYQNCHYPYADTLTAPGHASLSTGTSPYKHGIIANEWYDRSSGKSLVAVQSARYRPVPTPVDPAILGSSPERRRQPTIGDSLLAATKGRAKVVSLSLKDRAAILLAALRALCFWFSTNAGTFVTSTYYSDTLPSWVADFNRSRTADQWFGRQWKRLLPDLDYSRHSGPDDVEAEGIGYHQGRTFPHPMANGRKKLGRDYYQALTNSPYGSQLLLALAKIAIVAEKLGQHEVPDLLCLSFSSTDLIGHCWGPDSQEVLDITLHSDRIMADLLDFLDNQVGKGRYLLVLSADHGVCPIPELARARGLTAGRVSPKSLLSGGTAHLNARFSPRKHLPWIEAISGASFYLNRGALRESGLDAAVVEEALAGWARRVPGIQAAYTRTQLSRGPIANDATGEMVRRSFDEERSGDVMLVVAPYYLLSEPVAPRSTDSRTSHGSPHPYDTHVPFLVFGPGVRPGTRGERITPQSAASILARGLGVEPPSGAEAKVPAGLFVDPH